RAHQRNRVAASRVADDAIEQGGLHEDLRRAGAARRRTLASASAQCRDGRRTCSHQRSGNKLGQIVSYSQVALRAPRLRKILANQVHSERKRAEKLLVTAPRPLISHSYEEREPRDHAYTGGGDLASPPCLYRRRNIRCRERRHQPDLQLAEGY